MLEQRRPWWTLVLVCSLLLVTQTGCLQILQQRARAEREQKEAAEKAIHKAFTDEFKAAMAAGNWGAAAATFTLEREKALIRYGNWKGSMNTLWWKLRGLARSAADRRAYDDAVKLADVMDGVQATMPKDLRAEIDRDKAGWVAKRTEMQASWVQKLELPRADEAAGRKGLAAARYATLLAPPSAAAQQEIDAKICELAQAVAAPYHRRVYIEKGKVAGGPGQVELAAALERVAREAVYGPAVEIVATAAEADIAIRFDLEAERFDHTTANETRNGRYVSGSKVVPNSEIPRLRKEIAHWQKETQWKDKAAASIRCSGAGPCKSRIAHQNDAKKYRERVAGLQQKLAREKPTENKPIYTEMSYPVKVHTWKLTQPIAIQIRTKDGKTKRSEMKPDRQTSLVEHDAQPKLNLYAAKPAVPTADALREPMHKAMVPSAEYLVHNNIGARNDEIINKVKTTTDLEKGNWIAIFLMVNPKANADNRSFADKELWNVAKIPSGGSTLADKTAKCWKK